MDARSGKKIRRGRILDPVSGRGIVVACSHGVMHGAPQGLRNAPEISSVFDKLASADGVMVSPGMLPMVEDAFVGKGAPSLVLHLDWKNFARARYSPSRQGRAEGTLASLASLDDVAATGADAVMTYLYVGQKDTELERQEFERNAHVARECDRLGLALIIEPRSAMEGIEDDASSSEVMSLYCRLAAEVGADIVKAIWSGSVEGFAEVTDTCTAPVLLAGGPGGDDIDSTLRLATDAIDAGAAGVMFGRRVFASPEPEETLARLGKVVHGSARP